MLRMTYVRMTGLTWPDAKELQGAIGLVPTGAIEQHGPHLPLATDCFIAEELARRVAERIDERVVVAPALPGGLSSHHLAFPGTVTLPEEAFAAVLDAYVAAFERMGIHRIAVFTGHGGNFGFLGRYEAAHAERGTETRLIAHHDFEGYVDAMSAGAVEAGLEPAASDVHAGGIETSQGLALFPELVRPHANLTGYVTGDVGWQDRMYSEGIQAVTPIGVLGDPSNASAEAGEAIFAHLTDHLVNWIEVGLSLPMGAHSKS